MDPAFLPQLPLPASQLALFGALLVVGLLAGEATRRYTALPRITGYLLAGALLGPAMTGWIDGDTLFGLRRLIDLAIGLVVYELGYRLDFGWLRRNPWLLVTALAESLVCFGSIFAALSYFGFRPLLAATAAAIGTATSPAVVMLVAQELRAEGQITERMLLLTAVNTVFAYVGLTLLVPFLHLEHQVAWPLALAHPIYVLAASVATGGLACVVLLQIARWLGKHEDRQFVLLLATVILTTGLAHSLKLSVALALVTLGILARNADRAHALVPVRFGRIGLLFFVSLFVLTGASLDFHALGAASAAVVASFVMMRFLGKGLALLAFGRLSGIRPGGAGLLSVALLPMSGLAVVMVQDTVSLYPSFGRELAAVVLSAVVVLELLGPIATQFALRRAGEARPDG